MSNDQEINAAFLDKAVLESFKAVIYSSPVFQNHENYKHRYNLINVFIRRMESAVEYLNEHAETPKTETDLIVFLVYATILKDGIYKLYENIYGEKPPFVNEKKFFRLAHNYVKPCFTEETCPTDDAFFEYLRAMAFAHPYEVTRRGKDRPFLQTHEINYCPFVIADGPAMDYDASHDTVGIRIYSNIDASDLDDMFVSFTAVKNYLVDRYNSIDRLREWAETGIAEQQDLWSRVKVNRNQDQISILEEIKQILISRFEETDFVDDAIEYLSCPLSVGDNEVNVGLFRQAIIDAIPTICDCVDRFDYEGMANALYLIYALPKRMHVHAHYELEKIFEYLDHRNDWIDPYSDESWGLKQAKAFSQEFAKKWVLIDTEHMSYDEIRLLVRAACFLEKQEQDRQNEAK